MKTSKITQKVRQFVLTHDFIYSTISFSRKFPFKFIRKHFREQFIRTHFGVLEPRTSFGPERVDIETTSICNTSCYFCPHSKMKREKKHMSDAIFNKSLEEIKKHNVKNVSVSFMGEPLIDPKFFERVKKIKDSYECTTFISTNALQLTKEKSLRMIESKLDTIIISLDGVDQDSFSKIREGSFEKTVRNIEELISLKEKMKSETPYITLRIMVSSENKKDTKRFIERWEGKVNEIAFGKVHTWCEGGIKKSLNSPCLFLWSTLLILSNGDVVPCCMDYEGKLKLGNIMENSLEEIWNGEKIKMLRRQHINKKFSGICATCDINDGTIVKWWSYE